MNSLARKVFPTFVENSSPMSRLVAFAVNTYRCYADPLNPRPVSDKLPDYTVDDRGRFYQETRLPDGTTKPVRITDERVEWLRMIVSGRTAYSRVDDDFYKFS